MDLPYAGAVPRVGCSRSVAPHSTRFATCSLRERGYWSVYNLAFSSSSVAWASLRSVIAAVCGVCSPFEIQ